MGYSTNFKERIYSNIVLEFLRVSKTHSKTIRPLLNIVGFFFTRWQTKEAENETRVSIYICGAASARHLALVTDTSLFPSRSKHASAVLKATLTTKGL